MARRSESGVDRGEGVDQAEGGGESRTSSRVEREERATGSGRRRSGGRSSSEARRAEGLFKDVIELQQGILHAGIEAASTGLDTATRVTRNTVDRAFQRDFRDPGDVLRNLGKDADETARDMLDGLRDGPRRMHDGFYEKVKPSSRTRDRGERHRRAQDSSDEG